MRIQINGDSLISLKIKKKDDGTFELCEERTLLNSVATGGVTLSSIKNITIECEPTIRWRYSLNP